MFRYTHIIDYCNTDKICTKPACLTLEVRSSFSATSFSKASLWLKTFLQLIKSELKLYWFVHTLTVFSCEKFSPAEVLRHFFQEQLIFLYGNLRPFNNTVENTNQTTIPCTCITSAIHCSQAIAIVLILRGLYYMEERLTYWKSSRMLTPYFAHRLSSF